MYSELVQVDRMATRKMERWTIALDFLQYSNFVGYDERHLARWHRRTLQKFEMEAAQRLGASTKVGSII